MSTAQQRLLTPAEYLAFERTSPQKHEYLGGEVFAMTGASRNHNRITLNIASQLLSAFRGGPCEVFASDMRVKVSATGLYAYPDVTVACGELRFEDDHGDTLLNPLVVIEVLSDSAEKYDRGEKFAQYRNLSSLREYILVAQHQPRVEIFTRQDDDTCWMMRVVDNPSDEVRLTSINTTLPMTEIYARVELSEAQ